MSEKTEKKKGFSLLRVLLAVIIAVAVILVVMLVWAFFPRGNNQNSTELKPSGGTRSLVVYFSRDKVIDTDGVDAVTSASLLVDNREYVGFTTEAAEKIAAKTGADTYQILTENYYPKSFNGTAARSYVEGKLNTRPKLKDLPDDLDDYDVIYVGYPIWWFNAPMAVGTFLESYDLSGKTIVPFCTSETDSIDETMPFIRDVSKNATVTDGLTANDLNDEKLTEFLQKNGLL